MIRFVAIILLLCGSAQSVELLVQARPNWKRAEISTSWTKADFIDFWRQTHRGEIIEILPNGTVWGTMDIPPAFVLIKVPGVAMAQARKYRQPLIDSTNRIDTATVQPDSVNVKQRRFFFPKRVVDSALTLWNTDGSYITLTKAQAVATIKEYDIATVKQKIRNRLKQ